MRHILAKQLPLVPAPIDHPRARELAKMSELLDEMSEVVTLVHADLLGRNGKQVDPTKGRDGMTAEQVLRAMIVKQLNNYSYEELAFHLSDSSTYRSLCRMGIGDKPFDVSTLKKNIKAVRAETWEAINRKLVLRAAVNGIETGKKVRTDCTVVKSNIHSPTDSSLLLDCVRVLARLMTEASEDFGFSFNDHTRRAKRRAMGILNARTTEQRLPLYRDLLKVTDKTVKSAERIAQELEKVSPTDMKQALCTGQLADKLRHYVELTKRVISQTERRVLYGESVPAQEKIVSIFEPHTDILVKDRRDTLYGHKICLTTGASGLVTDVVVEQGNPADSTLATRMIQRQMDIYGKPPRQTTFDGAFASQANLTDIKALGVQDVAFSKSRGLSVEEMVKSSSVYRMLRNFRAGVEAVISFLKRTFGLDCCTWSGLPSFKAYVHASVLACNLLVLARHLLSA
jgi:IS5 family transposase